MTSISPVTVDGGPSQQSGGGVTANPGVDLRGRGPWSVLPPLVLGFFMIMVDTTIVNIAVPSLVKTFDTSLTAVGWVNSAYLLSFATLLLVSGRLGDRYGPRPLFMAGLVTFTLASLWCGLSGSITMLIIARAVQGVGAALMTPQTMAVITRVFPPAKRGAAMGVWGGVAGLATITGPVLGGVLVESWGWEWIFYVNIPVGVIALVLALRFVPRLPTHVAFFDWWGVALSALGLFAVIFGLQEGETYHWGTVHGLLSIPLILVVGAVLLVTFLWWQARIGEHALLPLSLFTHRNFALANVAGMAISFAMIGLFFPLTLFLQETLELSPLHAALVNLPGSLVSGIVAPLAGRLSDRVSGKWVTGAGFLVLAASMLWVHAIIAPGMSASEFYPPMVVFGIGTGLVFSPLANLATGGLDHRTAGAGAGAFNTTRQVGGVIGSAAIIAVLTSQLASAIPAGSSIEVANQGFADAVGATLWLVIGVLLLGAAAAAFMTRTVRADPLEQAPGQRS